MSIWGLSATIRAPAPDILRFAAYHLEQGAHRLYLYLDAANPVAYAHLKAHPKVRVQICDQAHWKKLSKKRPNRHQVRQSYNATHAYNRRAEVDWLIHMDVDEFLVSERSVAKCLGALGPCQMSARVRPMEKLGDSENAFKAFIPADATRRATVEQIYPTFGRYIRGGFLSHLAGKLFVRTGLPNIKLQIHNAFQNDATLQEAVELGSMDLAHCHAPSWDAWRAAFDDRFKHGSYRAELPAAAPAQQGGMSLHDLLSLLHTVAGDAGLRQFYDEVVRDSPTMRARLDAHGLLRIVDLDLATIARKHFPDADV